TLPSAAYEVLQRAAQDISAEIRDCLQKNERSSTTVLPQIFNGPAVDVFIKSVEYAKGSLDERAADALYDALRHELGAISTVNLSAMGDRGKLTEVEFDLSLRRKVFEEIEKKYETVTWKFLVVPKVTSAIDDFITVVFTVVSRDGLCARTTKTFKVPYDEIS